MSPLDLYNAQLSLEYIRADSNDFTYVLGDPFHGRRRKSFVSAALSDGELRLITLPTQMSILKTSKKNKR